MAYVQVLYFSLSQWGLSIHQSIQQPGYYMLSELSLQRLSGWIHLSSSYKRTICLLPRNNCMYAICLLVLFFCLYVLLIFLHCSFLHCSMPCWNNCLCKSNYQGCTALHHWKRCNLPYWVHLHSGRNAEHLLHWRTATKFVV